MPDDTQGSDRGTLRQVAWRELMPWLIIVRSFRLAIDPRQLLLAAVGVLLTAGGWSLLAYAFSGAGQPATKHLVESYRSWPWSPGPVDSAAEEFAVVAPASSRIAWRSSSPWPHAQPVSGSWSVLSRPFIQLFDRGLDVTGFALALLCAIWAAAVWSLFGGAIARLAAMRLARDERVPLGEGLRHARKRWGGYFWAPIFPLIGALLPTLGLAATGWLLRFELGIVLLGVLFPLLLVGGLVIAVLLLGLLFGWPLMWATISVEGTDTFDALSRTYAYVYQRPIHYLFYVVIATLFGWLGGILAYAFGTGVVYLALWGVSWSAGTARTELIVREVASRGVSIVVPPGGMPAAVATASGALPHGPAPTTGEPSPPKTEELNSVGRFGARLVAVWFGGVELLVVAFNFSFFWCAATAIYLLMRKQVDATEMDEVYVEEEEERYGLPPLETDAAGVPRAADVEAEAPPESNGGSQ